MKVYLAGPIRGVTDYHDRFASYAEQLRKQGHSVYNPAAANQEGRELPSIMALLLPVLCEQEAIALIPGWSISGGAQVELSLAEYLGLKVIEL